VIQGACTGYLQPLDVSCNKIIKNIIRQCEEDHYNANPNEWVEGKYSPGDRRVLVTHWVPKAWNILYIDHKDTIINTFKNVGISLNLDGSEDHLLSIRDLPNITIGEWRLPQEPDDNTIIVKAPQEDLNF
jgi:hypothetical protein